MWLLKANLTVNDYFVADTEEADTPPFSAVLTGLSTVQIVLTGDVDIKVRQSYVMRLTVNCYSLLIRNSYFLHCLNYGMSSHKPAKNYQKFDCPKEFIQSSTLTVLTA